MATEVTGQKQKIFVEDVETGSAVSEATGTKLAATMNKLCDEQVTHYTWAADGSYFISPVPDNAMGEEYLVPFDCEIVALRVYNKTSGLSGVTECDIVKKQAGGAFTSIFSTRPKIDFSSGADSEIVQQFLPTVATIFASSGSTPPVLVSPNLNQYDILRFNFIDKQTSPAEGFGIDIITRIR